VEEWRHRRYLGTITRVPERIASYLDHLGLRSGSKLPAERELARELGITRSGLRTGLERLEADGLICRHVGKGTFIGQNQRASQSGRSIDFENLMNPQNLMEVRIFLEPPAVALATMRATPDELDGIRSCFDSMLRTRSLVEYEHREILFAMIERRSADAEDRMRVHLREVRHDLIRASGGIVG
jgi:DNA-binding FadR family transcriptional regulator